jgi:regulatory protein
LLYYRVKWRKGDRKYMIITSIERQVKQPHRYNVYIDDQYAFSVHEDILIRHSLSKGMELDSSELEKLLHREEDNKALHAALHYLKFRSRSEKEIRQQLRRKGFSLATIEYVVESLSEQQYINDRQFAIQWTKYRMIEQSKGRRYVIEELKQKGIDDDRVEQALEQVDEETEKNKAMKLAEKRWIRYRDEDWPIVRRKLGQYLMRQGFPGDIVHSVLNEIRLLWDESQSS